MLKLLISIRNAEIVLKFTQMDQIRLRFSLSYFGEVKINVIWLKVQDQKGGACHNGSYIFKNGV